MTIISHAELAKVIHSNITEFSTMKHLHGHKAASKWLAEQILGGKRGNDDSKTGNGDNTG